MKQTRTLALVTAALLACTVSAVPAADWPMYGRDVTRNPVSPEKGAPIDWDIETGKNVKWSARLGSQTYAAPIVADGHVYIGTNNYAAYLERYPKEVDLGCLLCFRESDGEFLWQYSAEKLPTGRVHDWPYQGLGSSPLVEGERMWFVNNRWEVICADTQGFRDGENDGPYVDEPVKDPREADVVWTFDLMGELGVQPHTAGMGPDRRCSIAASYKDRIYVVTGNGVDATHINIPAPDAPSLVCFHKDTGKMLWTDSSPGKNILHTQIANPLVAEIAGRAQVIVPQGDGWIRSFDALTGKLIWKFDINFKESKWTLGGRGSRNNILATPVLYENRIYIASGQEPEHGEGMGRLVCIDPTKKGDISSQLAVDHKGNVIPHRRIQAVDPSKREKAIPNPNSGVIWEFGAKTIEEYEKQDFEEQMHRTVSSVAVHDGLVIVGDFAGLVHCLDAKTGKQHWTYDAFANIIAAPLIVAGTVYVADGDGDVAVFRLSADPDVAMKPIAEIYLGNAVYCSPTFAGGTLYIATRSKLYAIAEEKQQSDKPDDQTAGGYWPQWRGPNRDNVSTETGLLKRWPAGGPPLVWRAERLGDGIGPVSVAGHRIYAISRAADQEYVVALDEQTGAHLWTAYLGRTLNQGALMQWLTQRAPTVDGERLYAVSALGDLACLRTSNGRGVWRKKYVENLYGRRGPWGFGDRPLVDGDKLIVVPGGEVASVAALDKRTGKLLWRHAVHGDGWGLYSTGIVAEIGGVQQFITSFGKTAVGLRLDDGRRLWQADVSPRRRHNPFTPLVRDRNVLFPLGFGRELVRLQIVSGDERFKAHEGYTAKAYLDGFHDNTILLGDHLYLFGRIASCHDWKTGGPLWRNRIGRRSAAVYADNRVYLRDTEGLVRLVHVTPEGVTEHGRFTIPDAHRQSGATFPVIAGGRLYLRDNDRLFCYDIREGSHPVAEPKRILLPELAAAAVEKRRPVDPGSDVRRVPDSAFVPTPHDVVEKMLELAEVKKGEVVYDLGSGDGRILITAAKKYGSKAVGYEIDPELVKLSRKDVQEANVESLVSIKQADLFSADLTHADVVMLYLLPIQIEKLIPKLKTLKPGSRVVAHEFPLPGIEPDKTIIVESRQSGEKHTLYLWTAPLKTSNE